MLCRHTEAYPLFTMEILRSKETCAANDPSRPEPRQLLAEATAATEGVDPPDLRQARQLPATR